MSDARCSTCKRQLHWNGEWRSHDWRAFNSYYVHSALPFYDWFWGTERWSNTLRHPTYKRPQ